MTFIISFIMAFILAFIMAFIMTPIMTYRGAALCASGAARCTGFYGPSGKSSLTPFEKSFGKRVGETFRQ